MKKGKRIALALGTLLISTLSLIPSFAEGIGVEVEETVEATEMEEENLPVSSSNLASLPGARFFSVSSVNAPTENSEKKTIDEIQFQVGTLEGIMPNKPKDKMWVKELDLQGIKLKLHEKGTDKNLYFDAEDLEISSVIYYHKFVGENSQLALWQSYREKNGDKFKPGQYETVIKLASRNPNYEFSLWTDLTLSFSVPWSSSQSFTVPYSFYCFWVDDREEDVTKLEFHKDFRLTEEFPLKELRLYIPEKELKYSRSGEVLRKGTWEKNAQGIIVKDGKEEPVEIPMENIRENLGLESLSGELSYQAGDKITEPGAYRPKLQSLAIRDLPYRISFDGLDGDLVTKFYVNDKEWELDKKTASLEAIDPYSGGLQVDLYSPDTVLFQESKSETGGISSGGSGGSGRSSASSGGGSTSFKASPSGHVLGVERSLSEGEWVKDEIGWWYRRKDGTYPKNSWGYETYNGKSYWYYFLDSGYMATGWIELNGSKYYLFPISDGWMGRMLTGWHWIDGYCYYFGTNSENNEGHLYRNEKTTDGFMVDAEGRWLENGIVQVKK